MVCTNPCDDCKREGLPILFTRYAVGYSSRSEGQTLLDKFKPTGKLQAQPGGVSIKTGRYGVRMLRAGYLYLRIERRGLLEWEGYAIHPHGYLKQFPVMLPQQAEVKIACARDARQANNSLVWIKDAKSVKSLWYAFHPDPIDPAHLKREIEPNPAKYMQQFDVAGWLGGNTSQADSMQPAQLDKQVLEYAALGDEKVQVVGNEQFFGLMGMTPQERGWGNYEVEETDQQVIPTPDAAPVIIEEVRTVLVTQPTYQKAHGPRLEGMRKFLQDNKGAVVACEDALGIAQELSLHHLTAAIPYMKWLRETDSRGVSNAWKSSASQGIQVIKTAMEKKAVSDYDAGTDHMREVRDNMGSYYPGSDSPQPVKLRRPDGTYETITVQELNRRRQAELQTRINERVAKHDKAVEGLNDRATKAVDQYCDMDAVRTFDGLHRKKLHDRDTGMNSVAEDLVHWLKADSLTDRSLGLYSETASPETGDGERCAGQLCAILLQLDNSPRGREWYGSLDTFTPHKKNLVWRMLSLNNREISEEMVAALQLLSQPLPPDDGIPTDNKEAARDQKAYADAMAAIKTMSKTVKNADKINKETTKLLDAVEAYKATKQQVPAGKSDLEKILKDRAAAISKGRDAAAEIRKAALESRTSVLLAAVMGKFRVAPITKLEAMIARAQALMLVNGLGSKAAAHLVELQKDKLNSQQRKDVFQYLAHKVQKASRNFFNRGGADSAAQEMRVSYVLCGVSTLAIFPALARAYSRQDARSMADLTTATSTLVGSLKQARADFYEKAVYKKVPDVLAKTQKAGVSAVAETELLALKAGAARYVAAGTILAIVVDGVDGITAAKEGNLDLTAAYFARSITGGVSVYGALRAAKFVTAPQWLLRLNIWSAVATLLLTAAIAKIKGKAWENWLQAQPFKRSDSNKTPYRSEGDMQKDLADALVEIGA
ncbi:T6SS effector BTH_I2691 family protein [Ralstonia mannitolilytica]|uniref:T6SS effector BTH_I2691 family protein n=1 Tax=Ralstonia mannitolilytica TaxID=105219 RepID=UPI000CEDC949|nr:T6SS effector BTH_I2691 family protein [Ralstonia mannitolilytica]